ncbi:unnamed protein product [Pleuronectes platessa]|uniref:Uncharacterized protein n=1 Tax=Pleuronectes platessa TaxID=8262 RepID=A0A9N7U7R0_PLEPL|nr:unnamed protein product [Pleuronectes platessa]
MSEITGLKVGNQALQQKIDNFQEQNDMKLESSEASTMEAGRRQEPTPCESLGNDNMALKSQHSFRLPLHSHFLVSFHFALPPPVCSPPEDYTAHSHECICVILPIQLRRREREVRREEVRMNGAKVIEELEKLGREAFGLLDRRDPISHSKHLSFSV